jgi:hypothetical protein
MTVPFAEKEHKLWYGLSEQRSKEQRGLVVTSTSNLLLAPQSAVFEIVFLLLLGRYIVHCPPDSQSPTHISGMLSI